MKITAKPKASKSGLLPQIACLTAKSAFLSVKKNRIQDPVLQ
jgi:hypothetical protein